MFNKTLKFISLMSLTILMLGVFVIPVNAQSTSLDIQFENEPLFNEANFVPGDAVTRWVKVNNNTADNHYLGVSATDYYSCGDPVCLADALDLVISENGTELYHDSLTNFFNAGEISLSTVNAGANTQYDFSVTFLPTSGNDYQGLSTYFDFIVGTLGSDNSGGGSSGGGGGGFNSQPGIELTADYPSIKDLAGLPSETVTVHNSGNIVLTNGILTIDLPEDKLAFITANPNWNSLNPATGEAQWNISALGINGDYTVSFIVDPLLVGEAITSVDVNFDQAESHITLTENIFDNTNNSSGGGETGGGTGTETGGTGTETGGGTTGGGINNPNPPTGNVAGEHTVNLAGDEDNLPLQEKDKPQVEGVNLSCLSCPWWVWLIVIILHLFTVFSYGLLSHRKDDTPLDDTTKSKQTKSFIWLWYLLVVITLTIIYLLLIFVCKLPAIILAIVLLSYLAVLAIYYLIHQRQLKKLWVFVPLLLAIGPIVVYFFSGSWFWWLWLVVLILYILSLLVYYYSIYLPRNWNKWWLALLLLTLLVFVLEYILHLYLPCLGA